MPRLIIGLLAFVCLCAGRPALAAQARIVAAESVYGDIATQVAGPSASVVSILQSPEQDPHAFEVSPSVAREIQAARIVILNGAGYDPWMGSLLGVSAVPGRQVIEVARLVPAGAGRNPHLWYDPETAPAVAKAVAEALGAGRHRLAEFMSSLKPVQDKIAAMRGRFGGTKVTATEPVFGLMAAALGLAMLNEDFQYAVMNGSEPSPAQTAAFERSLRDHEARVLIYNAQTSDDATSRLLRIAKSAHVPVVAVTETEPPGKTYQRWMLDQLQALETALQK